MRVKRTEIEGEYSAPLSLVETHPYYYYYLSYARTLTTWEPFLPLI